MDGKSVLITGGSGTFGKAFCRYVLEKYNPHRLIVFSRDEFKHWEMRQEFTDSRMRFMLGDVRDLERLRLAFRVADIVIHAAALKHVPSGESNPSEVIKTNVMGAMNVVHAAIEMHIDRVIALSTDKACNPVNLYGGSKFCAEKLFVGANVLSGEGGTRFSVARYGNVAGSRGSVIPLFKKMRETGSISITVPNMTRFYMTVEKAVEFVDYCLARMVGGETFVPDMPKVDILRLASHIGGESCDYPIVGIRPGEKMHETLISEDEVRNTTVIHNGYVIRPDHDWFPRTAWRVGEFDHQACPEGFSYNSSNARHMTDDELREVCGE